MANENIFCMFQELIKPCQRARVLDGLCLFRALLVAQLPPFLNVLT